MAIDSELPPTSHEAVRALRAIRKRREGAPTDEEIRTAIAVAVQANVPKTQIADELGIARSWIYKHYQI